MKDALVTTSSSSSGSAARLPIAIVPSIRQTFTLTNIHGMHARPCAMIVRTLQPFRCAASVQCGGFTANPRSILGLLTLAAGCYSKVTFTMSGNDAPQAMAALKKLFQNGFASLYQSAEQPTRKSLTATLSR